MKKRKKVKGPKIYAITWYDAHYYAQSVYPEHVKKETPPFIMSDVGYYAGESKIDFKIAQEIDGNGRFAHIMSIPKTTITQKRRLK